MSVTAMPQAGTEAAAEAPKKSKKKLIIIVAAVLVLAGAAYYVLMVRGGPDKPAAPTPGLVVPLEPIQVNLAGEHYLRVGISLQMTADAEKEIDGGKALDATIAEFSGKPVAKVNDPRSRELYKKELLEKLAERYEKTVMDIYFTEFVTQ
jgi:flagellar FliL protein